MIVLKAAQEKFLGALQAVSGIVERRHTLPILANVLIRKTGGADRVHDQRPRDPGAHHAPSSAATRGNFATTVGARKLIDILRSMPADQTVTLTSSADQADAAGRQEPLHAADAAGRRLPAGAGGGRLRPGVQRAAEDAEGPDRPGALRDGGARHPLLPERHPVRRRRQEPDAGRDRRPPPGAGPGHARRRDPEAGGDPAAQDRARAAAPADATTTSADRDALRRQPGQVHASAAWSSSPSWSRASSPTTTA